MMLIRKVSADRWVGEWAVLSLVLESTEQDDCPGADVRVFPSVGLGETNEPSGLRTTDYYGSMVSRTGKRMLCSCGRLGR